MIYVTIALILQIISKTQMKDETMKTYIVYAERTILESVEIQANTEAEA